MGRQKVNPPGEGTSHRDSISTVGNPQKIKENHFLTKNIFFSLNSPSPLSNPGYMVSHNTPSPYYVHCQFVDRANLILYVASISYRVMISNFLYAPVRNVGAVLVIKGTRFTCEDFSMLYQILEEKNEPRRK